MRPKSDSYISASQTHPWWRLYPVPRFFSTLPPAAQVPGLALWQLLSNMLWGHPPAFRLQWSKFCLNCKLSGRRANAPECEIDAGERRRANQETVMGGSHWDRSNTHCDVITITESYHLLHHSWLIQYWANKKSRLLRLNMMEGTRINFSYFPFSGQKLSHQMHEPICWIQLPAPVPNPQETMFQRMLISAPLLPNPKRNLFHLNNALFPI